MHIYAHAEDEIQRFCSLAYHHSVCAGKARDAVRGIFSLSLHKLRLHMHKQKINFKGPFPLSIIRGLHSENNMN